MSRAKHWTWTLNNYTEEELEQINNLPDNQVEYLVYGKEVGENGMPHLQGYVIWKAACRLTTCKNRLSARAHVEITRGTPEENRTYCIKDGDFVEKGECPVTGQGRRTDLDRFYEWSDQFATANNRPPTTPEVARNYPSVLTKYPRVIEIQRLRFNAGPLVEGVARPWQQELADTLDEPADDRSINFYVDTEGNKGKSWFQRWYWTHHMDETQCLSIGKRDDLAHAIKESKKVFLFNVPRGQMEFLQYAVLEMMKDRIIFSPKYNSRTKVMQHHPHVVVFCNEYPDYTKMSQDRYVVTHMDNM